MCQAVKQLLEKQLYNANNAEKKAESKGKASKVEAIKKEQEMVSASTMHFYAYFGLSACLWIVQLKSKIERAEKLRRYEVRALTQQEGDRYRSVDVLALA